MDSSTNVDVAVASGVGVGVLIDGGYWLPSESLEVGWALMLALACLLAATLACWSGKVGW